MLGFWGHRNIVSSGKTPSARRTWVEITEPMLRSYMSWACHSSRSSHPTTTTAAAASSSSSSSVFHSFRSTNNTHATAWHAMMKRRGSEKEDSDEKDMRAKVDKALKKMRASATFVYNPYG